jgi:hypothetical protein
MPRTAALAPVRRVAVVTCATTILTCVTGVLGTLAAWHRYDVGVDYVAGVPGIGVADYVGADNTAAGVGLLWFLAYAVTVVTFLTWAWRTRGNAERLCPTPHRLGRGWVLGCWFVPGFPLVLLEDVWRTSRPAVPAGRHARELPKAPLVHFWWYSAMACALVGLWLGLVRRGEPTLSVLLEIAWTTTALAVLQCVAAGLVIGVVRRITRWQS